MLFRGSSLVAKCRTKQCDSFPDENGSESRSLGDGQMMGFVSSVGVRFRHVGLCLGVFFSFHDLFSLSFYLQRTNGRQEALQKSRQP